MYIEDILHTLVDNLEVNPSDSPILTSISRQVKKGNALTDRQHALIKTKLVEHKDVFDFDISPFLDSLRQPLRIVDRSQYVSIVSTLEKVGASEVYPSSQENWKWIKVRFPFAKKTIQVIEKLATAHSKVYDHKRGTHEHYFRLTERTVKDVVSAFINKQFTIDNQLVEYYNAIKEIEDNSESYLSVVGSNYVRNLHPSAVQLISKEIGEINGDNLIKIADRKRRYAIDGIEITPSYNTLVEKIAFRETPDLNIDPELYDINKVAEAFICLDRFPLIVVIDEDDCLNQVASVYDAFSYLIPKEQQAVLFRVDSQVEKYTVNNFIQDNQLNNWVDNMTKIVYINKSKLPKLLLKTEWKPTAALLLTGTRCHTHVDYYIKDLCDLVLFHDKEKSLFKLKRSYGYM